MTCNDDSIVRTVYSKEYFHPKEAKIDNACCNSDFTRILISDIFGNKKTNENDDESLCHAKKIFCLFFCTIQYAYSVATIFQKKTLKRLSIVYPHGCSLTINPNTIPIISSKDLCFPANKCLVAAFQHPQSNGTVIVLGSQMMFDDYYITKEQNSKFFNALIRFLATPPNSKVCFFETQSHCF